MSFDFLGPDGARKDGGFTPVARTCLSGPARAAGARMQARHGWEVTVGYGDPEAEAAACAQKVGWADTAHLGKLEIQAAGADLARIVAACADGGSLKLGSALRARDSWWCPLTAERALVICDAALTAELRETLQDAAATAPGWAGVVEVTTTYGAMTLAGPQSRELLARFCALDLRPDSCPVGGVRPGSLARSPGLVLREAADRYLLLFGWALGEYMWTVVADAGGHLGGRPVGLDALPALAGERREASHA